MAFQEIETVKDSRATGSAILPTFARQILHRSSVLVPFVLRHLSVLNPFGLRSNHLIIAVDFLVEVIV